MILFGSNIRSGLDQVLERKRTVMAQKLINIRVEIEKDTDADFDKWAEKEGRSKRRHAAILIRNLTSLAKTHRPDLERLGLVAKSPELSN